MGKSGYDRCGRCGGAKRDVSALCRKCNWDVMEEQAPDRFKSYVGRNGSCWMWQGVVNSVWGYGQFAVRGRQYRAHRYAYELYKGPIPRGLVVCHSCDEKLCVNPEHLWVGTQKQNMRDAATKGRTAVGEKNGMFGRTGTKNPWAKLNDHSVRSIRKMSADGVTQQALADKFKVSQNCIGAVLLGKSWGHVK